MAEDTMPAVEVQNEEGQDAVHYECAFHILPTIADEEVPRVVEKLKGFIAHAGGTVTADEVMTGYQLAYEVVKHMDGVNRRFNASHFGWVRFTLVPSAVAALEEELMHAPELMRYLVVRLTRADIEQPFSIFEMRKAKRVVEAPEGEAEASSDDAEQMPQEAEKGETE